MQTYSKPILGLSTIQSVMFVELFQDYGKELVQAGTTTTWLAHRCDD